MTGITQVFCLVCGNDCRKDYDGNRLLSGILQLSAHTHLVLDETCLEPGQLDSNGVHNVAALGTLISQQKVDYDFQYYKLEFQTDVPVLVLSEGKSLLPVSFNVVFREHSNMRVYLKVSKLNQ
jgi:hypothetical protein